jgi:hypothetical protein
VDEFGRATCWGDNEDGKTLAPADSVLSIAVAREWTCGVALADGALDCWGEGTSEAQLGVDLSGDYAWIDSSAATTCLIDQAGAATCMGGVKGTEAGPFIDLAVGAAGVCGLSPEGALSCWGEGPIVSPPAGAFVDISGAEVHACGLLDSREVLCWGLTDGGRTEGISGDYAMVEAGDPASCAIDERGGARCWGTGAPELTDSYYQMSNGVNYGCAITRSDEVVCWGQSDFGETQPPLD